MRLGQSLVFVLNETVAFFRRAWWLAIVTALPDLTYLAMSRFPMPWGASANIWIVSALMALTIVALTYWVVRFIALEHNVSAAIEVNRHSARTFVPYALTALVWIWLSMSLASTTGGPAGLVLRLAPELLIFVAPWAMTAPSGSTVIGPIRSVKLVAPHLGLAIGLLFVVMLINALLAYAIILLGWSWASRAPSSFMSNLSVMSTIAQAVVEVIFNVTFVAATYALALRTGVKVNEAAGLSAVFE